MKNTSLHSVLTQQHHDLGGKAAVISGATTLMYGDWWLCDPIFSGKSILLYFSDAASLAKALIAFDGVAKAICPLSNEIREGDLEHILSLHSFDYAVTNVSGSKQSIFSKKGIVPISLPDIGILKKSNSGGSKLTKWLVPTSGTTSKPKLVEHTLHSLANSALKSENGAEGNEVWALFYDPTRYAGYQVLFKALLKGSTLISPGLNDPISERVQVCIDNNVTHISATATLWRKILMSPGAENIPLKNIVLGGEAADQPTLNALRAKYPKAKIIHVYASTEAGVAMSVSDGLAGFPIEYTEEQSAGTKLKIVNDRLYINSKAAGSSYIGERELFDSDGWVDTGDLVRLEEGRFFVIGRANGVINVGGDKILPERVRHLLLEHPKVSDAHIYGKKNPFTGMLLVADVKLARGADPKTIPNELKEFVRHQLSATHEPKIINIVDDIATNSTGKVT